MKQILFLMILVLNSLALADQKPLAELNDDCREFLSRFLPSHFSKDWIQVPEDWDHPEATKIKVFYYYRKALLPSNLPQTPVVFFNGGPAANSHSSVTYLENHTESKQLPFVYIDQRGTGCSDNFPNANTEANAQRLTHYSSRAIVKDAEKIREVLFGKNSKWKVFGQSYGGMIVQRYISLFPKSIVSAHSHGYSVMSDQADWMKYRILSQKRVAEEYFKIYPNDLVSLEKIKKNIPADLCAKTEESKICGPALLDGLTRPLGFSDEWEFLHWWIEQLAVYDWKDEGLFTGYMNMYINDMMRSSFANLVINQVEIGRGQSDHELCQTAMQRLSAEGDDSNLWPLNECRILLALNTKYDDLVMKITKTDVLKTVDIFNSLKVNPTLLFYMYSGEKDVFVPIETFNEEINMLGAFVKYKQFPNSGHEGFNTEQDVWSDLISN